MRKGPTLSQPPEWPAPDGCLPSVLGFEDERAFSDLVRHLESGVPMAILVGAGISARAGVPTASKIVRILRRLGRIDTPLSYPEAMEAAFDNRSARRGFLERMLLGRPPGIEHFVLAHLVERGFFRNIFTTNFDHLTEIALAQTCSSQEVRVYLHRETLETLESKDRVTRVIKLHGDYLFEGLANTDEEMRAAISFDMRQKLASALDGTGLVVIAYAGDASVLAILEDLSRNPDTLRHGIWWIFHDPPGGRNEEIQARVKERDRIENFLAKARAGSKPAVLIRNPHGVGWLLAEIFRRTTGTPPAKPLFGCGPGSNLAPQVAFPLHSTPTGYSRPDQDPDYEELMRAVSHPGIVVLQGPSGAGKTRIVSRWTEESPLPIFYFSFLFCRISPDREAFDIGLRQLLSRRSLSHSTLDPLELLFRNGGAAVLDDLPVAPAGLAGSRVISGFRPSFQELLASLGAARARAARGNLIVIVPPKLDPERQRELESALQGSDFDSVEVGAAGLHPRRFRDVYRQLSEAQRRLARTMAWLRYAEPLSLLARLVNLQGTLQESVEALSREGLVVGHAGNYGIRPSYRLALLRLQLENQPRQNRVRDMVLNMAERLAEAAEEPEQLHRLHYLLEAENLYYVANRDFKANRWARAVDLAARASPYFLSLGPAAQQFFLRTLSDYAQRFGPQMAESLSLSDYATLSWVLGELGCVRRFENPQRLDASSLRKCFAGSKENSLAEIATVHPNLVAVRDLATRLYYRLLDMALGRSPFLAAWLTISPSLEEGEPLEPTALRMVNRLLEELSRPERRLDSLHLSIRGSVQLGLGGMIPKMLDPDASEISRRLAEEAADILAKAAAESYSQAKDETGLAAAQRVAGVIFMNSGRYQEARRILLPLLRKHLERQGFDRFKASELNNLFYTFLGTGALRLAESFFHEGNYHYDRARQGALLIPLLTLATVAADRNPLAQNLSRRVDLEKVLPEPVNLARKAYAIWSKLPRFEKRVGFPRLVDALVQIVESYLGRGQRDEARLVLVLVNLVCISHSVESEPEGRDQGAFETAPFSHVVELNRRFATETERQEAPD